MLVMDRKPTRTVASRIGADLRVERTDIVFHDLTGDRLRIEVTVHNAGELPSRPEVMRIESAPFGAFVTWRPLTQLIVPALEPGESRELSIEVPRPRPVPLGDFSRVPPRRVLTTLSSPDQPTRRPNTGIQALLGLMWQRRSTRSQTVRPATDTSLAPDLWDLLGQDQPHWAGNINVFVGNRPVERHLAKALRVHPGLTNLAMFVVGNPRRHDAFAFELTGLDAAWKAALYDVTNGKSLAIGPSGACIEERQWVESNDGLLVILATRPPSNCSVGNLEVHVTRRADQKAAIVEFNLNPTAQGPGCYTL
jgi:hypothetical protein